MLESELSRPFDDCRDDARRRLLERGVPCQKVIAVDVNAVLFLNRQGRPMTAWLKRTASELQVYTEAGFQAFEEVDR